MEINTEEQAFEALEAVLAWAQEAPESEHGGAIGLTCQRGRIVASRVAGDETVGVSTYNTVEEAAEKAADMERAFRRWQQLARP